MITHCMKKLNHVLLCCILLTLPAVPAVCQITGRNMLVFQPVYDGAPVQFTQAYYPLNRNDSVRFESLKFYVSKIELLNKGILAYAEDNSFHLMDAASATTMLIKLNVPEGVTYTTIRFTLGIDSVTNVAGALGGDLDPTKGMYWTWQSGYINFKLEGSCSVSNARNHEFQYHIGGYRYPNSATQVVTLENVVARKCLVQIDLGEFIRGIDMTTTDHIMAPSVEAVTLARKLASCIRMMRP